MNPGAAISRYTPSLMAPELLEQLFVGRERLLSSVVERIREASEGPGRNHTLLVGPRGAGKTHLVALAHHRAEGLRADGHRLQLAWLPEDPWTIVGYRQLLATVASAAGLPSGGDSATLEAVLTQAADDDGPVVVFVENLDWIFEAIGDDGQQRLRHLLQDSRALLLVATTTAIDRNLSDQSRPFYGFFTTSRLEPFGVDEAASMLEAIAAATGQEDLERYLGTDEAKARLRAVEHLAGGQPRMWSALASSLSIGGLSELVDLLLTRFDDLTPYYQERLARLSPRQRVAVAELAALDRPISVKELAERLEVDQRSLGKTVNELVERGWAAPVTSPLLEGKIDKRFTFYELAEPLARLAFQIKETRGEPLRVVVDFLKHWFDPEQLSISTTTEIERRYLQTALEAQDHDAVIAVTRSLSRLPETRASSVAVLGEVDDALMTLSTGESGLFLRLPPPIRSAIEGIDSGGDPDGLRLQVHHLALEEFGYVRHDRMRTWIKRAHTLSALGEEGRLALLMWLGRSWRFDEAIAGLGDGTTVSEIDVRADIAISAWSAGQYSLAAELERQVLDSRTVLLGSGHPDTLWAKSNLAATYSSLGRESDALDLKLEVTAAREKEFGPSHPDTLSARGNLSNSLRLLGRLEEALTIAEDVERQSIATLGVDNAETLRAQLNLAAVYIAYGRLTEGLGLERKAATARDLLLGSDHPDSLQARANLAASLAVNGHLQEAEDTYRDVLSRSKRILGESHPDTMLTQSNLARVLALRGDLEQARSLMVSVAPRLSEVLGGDHPQTLSVLRFSELL